VDEEDEEGKRLRYYETPILDQDTIDKLRDFAEYTYFDEKGNAYENDTGQYWYYVYNVDQTREQVNFAYLRSFSGESSSELSELPGVVDTPPEFSPEEESEQQQQVIEVSSDDEADRIENTPELDQAQFWIEALDSEIKDGNPMYFQSTDKIYYYFRNANGKWSKQTPEPVDGFKIIRNQDDFMFEPLKVNGQVVQKKPELMMELFKRMLRQYKKPIEYGGMSDELKVFLGAAFFEKEDLTTFSDEDTFSVGEVRKKKHYKIPFVFFQA